MLILCFSQLSFAQDDVGDVPIQESTPRTMTATGAAKKKSQSDNNLQEEYQKLKGPPPKNTDTTGKDNPSVRVQSDIMATLSSAEGIENEVMLYREVVRRYTWLEGLGEPLSQEEANHLPFYFKLSVKNEAGHYQLVEAMHGSELTTQHSLTPYILSKTNDTTFHDNEWMDRLMTIGKWFFYTDLSGENVVEERAYEAKKTNARLVYAMQPVRNDSDHVTISYLDAWGYPADMSETRDHYYIDEWDNAIDESTDYTYGNVVYITYDRHGCDSIIDYLDGAGYRRPNTAGVDQHRYVYDDHYRPLLSTSCNCAGDYVIDNWGNCGVRYSYNDHDNTYSVVHVDAELRPMRMPAKRADADHAYIRCDFKKDRWGRIEEAVYLTAEGENDTTLSGIHQIQYEYSDDGQILQTSYYDIKGNIKFKISSGKDKQEKNISVQDTLYCSQTKKQHGWYAPMDTITKEMASHITPSYRFTHKNKAGHWERMECLDGYGHFSTGNFQPYLEHAEDTDQNVNQGWLEKVNTTCIYEFIADLSGEELIQERGYDKDTNIIYTLSRVPTGEKQFIYSYKDGYGLPVEMQTNNSSYTYGTLIEVTEDIWGNDSIIIYVDAKGHYKSNFLDFMERIHDEDGHLLRCHFYNRYETKTKDLAYSWEGCHLKSCTPTANISSHNILDDLDEYFVNVYEKYVQDNFRENNYPINSYTINYSYDTFNRKIAEYYTDAEGNPATNEYGQHKIKYTYNERGQIIELAGYDNEQNLSPLSESMAAKCKYEYDAEGRILSNIWLDKNGHPIRTSGYLSREEHRYDSNGNEVFVAQYSSETNKEEIFFLRETTSDHILTRWSDATYQVDSLDSKGRIFHSAFFDQNDEPEMSVGYAYMTTNYIDEPHRCTCIQTTYDVDAHRINVDEVCETKTLTDSLNYTATKWEYDADGRLINVYIVQYDKKFETPISLQNANRWGKPCRSGASYGLCYSREVTLNHATDESSFFVAKDEFGDPDYCSGNSSLYYYVKGYPNSSNYKFFDEHNHEIESFDELRDSLPKVMTIEVVDSVAYEHGLRDNDIILIYGDDYTVDLDNTLSLNDFRFNWTLRSVMDAEKNKQMVVFRIEDAATNQYSLVQINDLYGTPSELGFLPHIRYLTEKQKNRIQKVIQDSINNGSLIGALYDLRLNKLKFNSYTSRWSNNHLVVVAFKDLYLSDRAIPFGSYVTDPAILIGACIHERNLTWTMTNTTIENLMKILHTRYYDLKQYPTMHLYFTKDLNNIIHLPVTEQEDYTDWIPGYVSDDIYQELLKLNDGVKKDIFSLRQQLPIIDTRNLVGQWSIRSNTFETTYALSGTINFFKNGKCRGKITDYGFYTFSDGDRMVLKLEKTHKGRWEHNGVLISFQSDSSQITCVDLISDDGNDHNFFIEYLNKNMKIYQDELINAMTYPHNYNYWEDNWVIRSLTPETLIIENGTGDGVTLVKKHGKTRGEVRKNN